MMTRTLLLAVAVAGPLAAQAPKAPDFAETVAPFLDEHTLVVARLDLSKVQVEPFAGLMAMLGGSDEDTATMLKVAKTWLAEFAKKGGRDVFVTYGAADFPTLPCVLIPINESPEQRKDLGDLIKSAVGDDEYLIEKIHGCMAVGKENALDRLKARKPVKRFDLLEALDLGKDDPVQLAFAMSEDAKKIHEEIAPTLPDELGGGSVTKLTRGVKWAALTVGPAPKLSARWTVMAASPDAAKELNATQELVRKQGLKLLTAEMPEAGAPLRLQIEKAITAITGKTDGSKVIFEWEIGEALKEFKADLPASPVKTAADRARSSNNLKQIVIALHNYHEVTGHFPTDIRDKAGKPLLSWRVRILPYIEQAVLYEKFKLDEPWDSPANKPLSDMAIKLFVSPRQKGDAKNLTTYLAPSGKGFMWDDPKGQKITDVTDGTSNTILLLEADDEAAVPWAKPEDLKIDPAAPMKQLLGHYTDGFMSAFADGSVRYFKKTLPTASLNAYLTRGGGEIVQEEDEKAPPPKTPTKTPPTSK